MNTTSRAFKFVLLASSLGVLGLLAWLNARLTPDTRIMALHTVTPDGVHGLIYNTGPGGITESTQGMARNAMMHEMIHALKSTRLFDYDVPYAAALGYYEEWHSDGRLSDSARRRDFEKGAKETNRIAALDRLVKKYRSSSGGEDMQSYADGAIIAGIMASEFGRNKEAGGRCLFGLTMGLDAAEAAVLAKDSGAYDIVTRLRSGSYSVIDAESLQADMRPLEVPSQIAIRRYVSRLDHQYRSIFTLLGTDVRRAVGPAGQDFELPDRRTSSQDNGVAAPEDMRLESRPDRPRFAGQKSEAADHATPSQDQVIASGDMRFKNNVRGKAWTQGKVPLMFGSTVSREKRELFFRATLPVTQVITLEFIDCEANGCRDTDGYLFIFDGAENYSFVGMIGGRQEVSVATWNVETIQHLLRHVLGLGEGEGESLID